MEVRGEQIEGSKLVRDFCCCCGEAMRVKSVEHGPNTCLDCKNTVNPNQGEANRAYPQRAKMGHGRS